MAPKAENLYRVRVEGDYWALANGQKSMKGYEFEFVANDAMKKAGLLSVFRNSLTQKNGSDSTILKQMKKKYPDYKRFRTHEITEVTNLNGNQQVRELRLMNRPQIVKFIDSKGYPIECNLYPSTSDLRQALQDYRDNPESFLKFQEKRKLSRGPELQISRDLELLNNLQEQEQQRESDAPEVVSQADAYQAPDELDDFRIPEFDDEDELNNIINGV